MFGPVAMPAALVATLNSEIVRIMNLPEIRDRVSKGRSDVIADAPEHFIAQMRAETELWLRVIHEKNIKPD